MSLDPDRLALGEVGRIHLHGLPPDTIVTGTIGDRPLAFFAYAGGQAALIGIDLETRPGLQPWTVTALPPDRGLRTASGILPVHGREFSVQRLTLPRAMVDLDPATTLRTAAEGDRLRTLYRTATSERLWRGPFVRPAPGDAAGTGFGVRRIINGKPRMPHAGVDFAVPGGTPVVAANAGRVALVGEFFFPGRLVVLDHGLGLYTLYFHLDRIAVAEGDRIHRGQPIGSVGATGRATGPHLHFGAQMGSARIDPEALLRLSVTD